MKKREDGIEVYRNENSLDGRLSPINSIRNKGYSHYTMVSCPKCRRTIKASNTRAFVCAYKKSSSETEVILGELLFCSYECILDWFVPSEMGKE